MGQEELKEFGVSQDEINKAKDFHPTLRLSQLDVGEAVTLRFLEDKPRKVVYEKDGKQESFNVIKIMLLKRIQKDGGSLEIDSEYDLPLSSKTLNLGIARIASKSNFMIADKVIKVRVDTADYKQFGENRCYRVSEI